MKVKIYDRPNRPSPYGVKWTVKGKRKFKFFENKSLRNDFYSKLLKKQKQYGNAILDLSAEDAAIYKKCLEYVEDPHDMVSACREYAEKHNLIEVDFNEAFDEYLKEKITLGREENYYRSHKNIFSRASRSLPKELYCWTDELVRAWSLKLAKTFIPVTVRNHIKALRAFCNWAVTKNYLRHNPFKNAPVPVVIQKEVEFLSVAETKKLFKAAMEQYPNAVAYMGLSCFAGIRSSACARLNLEQINVSQRGILIWAGQQKNKRRIYLDGHETNLWIWIEWARKNAPEGFELTKRQWDAVRGKVAKAAGVEMPHNAFRHSFCTYHVALHGDAGKTATLLTHRGSVSMLYDHYKGNAGRKEAERYFAIAPQTVKK